MRLDTLKPAEGSRKAAVRVGRGIGSGLGKTCGRGVKGAGARKSAHKRPGFEGGQMPMKIRYQSLVSGLQRLTLLLRLP